MPHVLTVFFFPSGNFALSFVQVDQIQELIGAQIRNSVNAFACTNSLKDARKQDERVKDS